MRTEQASYKAGFHWGVHYLGSPVSLSPEETSKCARQLPDLWKHPLNNSDPALRKARNSTHKMEIESDGNNELKDAANGSEGQSSLIENTSSPQSELESSSSATFAVIAAILIINFFIISTLGHPGWDWANWLGSALACTTLSFATAALLLLFGYAIDFIPKPLKPYRMHFFISKLAIPMLIASIFWTWRTFYTTMEDKDRIESLHQYEYAESQRNIFNAKAQSIINAVKSEKEYSIKMDLRKKTTSLKVDGWKAGYFENNKWLVIFQWSEDGSGKWLPYEYDDYLQTTKYIFDDENLTKSYIEKSDEGNSLKEAVSKSIKSWYGPLK